MCNLSPMNEHVELSWASIQHREEIACSPAVDLTSITPLHRYAKMLQSHANGISAYARFKLTTARIEAGSVAIGMIRKRARGLLDQGYFKLKIRQSAVPAPPLALFPKARKLPHASA